MAAKKDARSTAAKKRASARAAGRTRQSYATPGKVTEAGVGNIPVSVARAAMTIAKHLEKGKKSTKAADKGKKASTSKDPDVAFYQKALSNPTARRVSAESRKANKDRKAAAHKADAPARARAAERERLKRQGYKGPTPKGTSARNPRLTVQRSPRAF